MPTNWDTKGNLPKVKDIFYYYQGLKKKKGLEVSGVGLGDSSKLGVLFYELLNI